MPSHAQQATTVGEVTAPYPTVENISLEWAVSGDSDADAAVTVRYRPAGSSEWLQGLPLRRILAGEAEGFSWDNRHAGSLFHLAADTTYEIELTLTDPDGGSDQRTLTVTTRPVPAAAEDASRKQVTPASLEAQLSGAEPGDLLLLADGDYDGFTVEADGSENEPIVIRAEHAGQAQIQGDVRLDGRSFVYLEGLSVHGMIKLNDSEGIVVRGCTVNTEDYGIVAYGSGSTNGYFCDNIVTGPTEWRNDATGADGDNLGEGIQLTGPGNVICYNRVRGFRDCLSTLEDDEAVDQTSIDIYGNDLEVCADDAIEADFTMGNTRVYSNRITRSFVGLSSQPSLGGPAYFIRNLMYNILYSPFKLHRGSVGDVAFHNTVVKCGDAFAVYTDDVWYDAWFRNNLFIGGSGGGTFGGYDNGDGAVAYLSAADPSCSFDYDGYGSTGTGRFEGRIGDARFSSLAQMHSATTEKHAVEVDLSVFASDVTHPEEPFPGPEFPDLTLAEGSAAVDSGQLLANVNDGYSGDAPDLGALELGQTPPSYGPRSSDEGTGGTGGTSGTGGAGTQGGTGGTGGRSQSGAGVPSSNTGGTGGTGGRNQSGAGAPPSETGGTGGTSGTGAKGSTGGTGGRSQSGAGAPPGETGGTAAAAEPAGAAGVSRGVSDGDDAGADGGCGCHIPGHGRPSTLGGLVLGLVLLMRRSRRQ